MATREQRSGSVGRQQKVEGSNLFSRFPEPRSERGFRRSGVGLRSAALGSVPPNEASNSPTGTISSMDWTTRLRFRDLRGHNPKSSG